MTVTSMTLTAGASMLANGSDPSIGAKPIASNAGVTLNLVDSTTGLTGNPTLYSMNYYTVQIQNIQSTLYDVTAKVANLANTYINEFSSMTNGLGDNVFSAPFDLYSGNAYAVMHTDDSVDSVLTFGRTESANVLGGAINSGEIEGDARTFATALTGSISFVQNSNQSINAANNSANAFTGGTFAGMDNVASGALSGVNLAGPAFGADCSLLGTVINFSAIPNLGSPGQMLSNMLDAGTLGPMYEQLSKVVLSPRLAATLGATPPPTTNILLGSLGLDLNNLARVGAGLPQGIQEQIYIAFATLSTDDVSQVKAILKCTQVNVVAGSDLFDPTKLFPTSFQTLTAPVRTGKLGTRAIYVDSSGSVNPIFSDLGVRLNGMIPDNLAVANGALSLSLGQIKGIEATDITTFTGAASNLETMKDLPDIQNLTTYIPAGVAEYWQDYYGVQNNIQLATGPSANFTIADCIGYAAGYNSAAPLQQNYDLLTTMNANGDLDVFYKDDGSSSADTGVLVVLEYLIDGTYVSGPNWVIPVGVYGAGTYSSFADAYTAVITAAVSLMQSVYSGNTTAQTVQANFKRIQEQLAREKLIRAKMDMTVSALVPSENNAISLSNSLPVYALDTTSGGTSEYLERIMNIDSLGGQAAIAAMRESRNTNNLDAAHLQQDGGLNLTPPLNPGAISSSQYTEDEASAIIVK